MINAVRRGLILVDRELRVVVWNRACEDLWGLRADETIGRKLSALDIGLPVETVRPLIGDAFVDPHSSSEIVVDAVNRRGRQTRVRVTSTPFPDTNGGVGGSLLLMEVLS